MGAKAGYCARPLHTTPPKGWADHLSHPASLTPGHTPTLTPYKEPALPHSRGASKEGNLLLVPTPHCCSRSSNRALSEFLVWPLINFYLLTRPRTLVGNILCGNHEGTIVPFPGEDLGTSGTTECSFPVGDKWPPEPLFQRNRIW